MTIFLLKSTSFCYKLFPAFLLRNRTNYTDLAGDTVFVFQAITIYDITKQSLPVTPGSVCTTSVQTNYCGWGTVKKRSIEQLNHGIHIRNNKISNIISTTWIQKTCHQSSFHPWPFYVLIQLFLMQTSACIRIPHHPSRTTP